MRQSTILFMMLLLLIAGCSRREEATPTPLSPATDEPAATDTPEVATPEAETPTPTAESGGQPTAGEAPIYLAIFWHQHQPVYFKDPETNVYVRPWVRVHAAKDYVDMATTVARYPDIHVSFNLTPSLIRQLDDLAAGAKDLYWVLTEVPAEELDDEQKQFILDRFFDTNRKIIGRFPRYQELLVQRDNSDNPVEAFEVQDYRDLQVLFNLAWTDPDWLAAEPLASLVAKERDYSENDKITVLAEHLRLVREVVPVHSELQNQGQIEVTITPFAHPILPLLINTNLAQEAMPGAALPETEFSYLQDAAAQLELGVQLYEEHFGHPPVGMWPAEGSVAEEMVGLVAENGIQWMASDEGVLANSLGFENFTRDSAEVVNEADVLYRPYYVKGGFGDPVAIVFRDVVISDRVGFTYSGLPGETAAADFINRIHAIREQLIESGAEGPHLVSVILDGENAWENYDNDGKEFLHALYQGLSEDPLIKTVTPTEFLEMAPDQPTIDDLWAGSWISHDFSTWIGEDEENQAWNLLVETREFLRQYEVGELEASPEALAQAQTLMYIAEGSDWFWWYGADQNSGNDGDFDQQFRDTLKGVYTALGQEPPVTLGVPIIPQEPVAAARPSTGLISPAIDGPAGEEEWAAAGLYLAEGGVMASAGPVFTDLAYGFDSQNLYLNVNAAGAWSSLAGEGGVGVVEVYLSAPGGGAANNLSQGGTVLGFPANRLVEVKLENGAVVSATLRLAAGGGWEEAATPLEQAAAGENSLELAIPLALLGNADVGDRLNLRAIYRRPEAAGDLLNLLDSAQLPGAGPAALGVPDLGLTTIVLNVDDPASDDHGPGSYTYPQDGVFSDGNFDITNFQVGYDEENVIFRFTMRGPVPNPWGSPNGLALKTFDIYIDADGDGQGGQAMLPGRNLAFQEGYARDFAVTAEGWQPGVFAPTEEGGQRKVAGASEMTILADPGQQKVTIRVAKSVLGDTPEAWRYAAVVMSQDGFPANGVLRIRDVNPAAEQWRVGGAPEGATNHTWVIDLVWAEAGRKSG
ncbi:MAG: glycoside hydrolase [Chloroflexi bacterium]|nr:glycoside hydrolase [Chloroflexota bacterium]